MQSLLDWASHLERGLVIDIMRSILLVLLLVLSRMGLQRALGSNPNLPVESRRRWSVNIRNGLIGLGLVGLVTIWAKELEALAVSLVAVAAALVLATKELIMCFAGSFLRAMGNSYGLGSHIEVAQYRGRVVDINLFSTTIMEIGPAHEAHLLSGRAISFPNSLLLTNPVIRENYMGEYVVHMITVPMGWAISPTVGLALLKEVAEKVCLPHVEAARRHMERIEARHLVDTPSVDPILSVQPIDDKIYRMLLRVAIPARERQRVEQAILKEFLDRVHPLRQAPPSVGPTQPA